MNILPSDEEAVLSALLAEEERMQQEEAAGLVAALGTGSAIAGAGAGITAELHRRKGLLPEGQQTYGSAASSLLGDARAAAEVLIGRSQYDRDIHDYVKETERTKKKDALGEKITLGKGKDKEFFVKKNIDGTVKDQGRVVPVRSIRSYAEAPDLNIPQDADAFADSRRNPYLNISPGSERGLNPLTQFAVSARDAFTPSSEDFLSLKRQFRQDQGLSAEGPRTDTVMGRIPFWDGIRDVAGKTPVIGYSPAEADFRSRNNMSLMGDGAAQKVGGLFGRAGSDFVNNGARSLWWLLNAPQAVVDIGSEGAMGLTNRQGLYGQDLVSYDEALNRDWINAEGDPRNNEVRRATIDSNVDPAYQQRYNEVQIPESAIGDTGNMKRRNVYSRRRTGNNLSTLLALPAAVAINTGLGLNNPFGGGDSGRKAIFADPDDPVQTSNVVAEVGAKYILGRTGDLLPWDEFKQVRPDVSRDEYMDYKAYRWDKGVDLNPFDDGKVSSPLGLLKYNSEGIDGAEVQFLGKDMPLTTTIMPTAIAMAGATLGTALGRYGGLNEFGIQEAIDQDNARIEAYKKDDARKDRIPGLEKKNQNRQKRLDFLGRMPLGRIKGKSPVLTGLAGGGAGLLAGSLIGNEIDRRRREEKENRFGV